MQETRPVEKQEELCWGKAHRVTFYVAVGLSLASMLIAGPVLTLPVTAWFPEGALNAMFGEENLGAHRAHMEGATTLFWLTVIAMLAQFRRPQHKAAPLWAVAVAWPFFLGLELTHLVDPYSIIVTVLVLAVLALHPNRRPQGRITWTGGVGRAVAPVLAGGAAVYALQQTLLQITGVTGDPHVDASHYALMAAAAVGISVSALLGSSNFPGHLISAWSAGILTINVGVFFIGHPNQASSLGPVLGSAIVILALLYLVVNTRTRTEPVSETASAV